MASSNKSKVKMSEIATFTPLGYMGELGNQMFQVAAVTGYARKSGKEPIFPEWTCKISGNDYRNIFKNPPLMKYDSQPIHQRYHYEGLKFVDIPVVPGNVDFVGYFQSEKFFQNCKEEIYQMYQPNEEIQNYIEEKYSSIISLSDKVCVHVRTAKRSRNDYDVHASASNDFLRRAQEKIHSENYVIFSDNFEEAKKILPEGKNYIFIEGEKNYVDLFLMTYFDRYILSPSTFGWWGAWLSKCRNPEVVIKEYWFTLGREKEHLNDNDIPVETWQKL